MVPKHKVHDYLKIQFQIDFQEKQKIYYQMK